MIEGWTTNHKNFHKNGAECAETTRVKEQKQLPSFPERHLWTSKSQILSAKSSNKILRLSTTNCRLKSSNSIPECHQLSFFTFCKLMSSLTVGGTWNKTTKLNRDWELNFMKTSFRLHNYHNWSLSFSLSFFFRPSCTYSTFDAF